MPPRNGCHYAASNISMNGGPVGDAKSEFVRGQVHINSIEEMWARLKLSLQAIYMGVSQKHLQRYCAESSFRYNRREWDDGERFVSWFQHCHGRLMYRTLIAD